MFRRVNHVCPVKPEEIRRANSFLRVVNLTNVGQARADLLANVLDDEIVLSDVLQCFWNIFNEFGH